MATARRDNCARSGMACSECNDLLVAPKWSAYVSNHEVRHVWSCENCGHEIEMAVNLRFDTTSAQSKSLESTVVA
jgi:RNase P subunit RPR2